MASSVHILLSTDSMPTSSSSDPARSRTAIFAFFKTSVKAYCPQYILVLRKCHSSPVVTNPYWTSSISSRFLLLLRASITAVHCAKFCALPLTRSAFFTSVTRIETSFPFFMQMIS
eukprot:TRINITY_DN7972_c0_g1::TRINITY_DN7972_c0_g1_i1::g.15572::m.15572 TRINITY_DN7972_c0_g1::TRINITY_DN7972_c0_g1_i1::g.15572  ORF type:complete len:116 (-),score=-18.59,DUF732/PF05305.9/0.16 TRINITY_DN7972_c0_g1_i1:867-1214(-)